MASRATLLVPPLDSLDSSPGYGFAALDDAVIEARSGAIVVALSDADRDAILAHVARRLRAAGCLVVEVAAHTTTSIFREAAAQLDLQGLPPTVSAHAAALATSQLRVAILAPLPRSGSWDDAVAREVANDGRTILIFATTGAAPSWAAASFDVSSEMTTDDKARWLMAMAESSAGLVRERSLRGLEAWWGRTPARSTQGLSSAARDIATCLALAGRSLPKSAFHSSEIRAVQELVSNGVITDNDAALVLAPAVDTRELQARASGTNRERTARILLSKAGGLQDDPWASARAASLLLTEEPAEANAAVDRAMAAAVDASIKADLDDAWFEAVTGHRGENVLLRVQGAERAIALGRPHAALRWCESIPRSQHDIRICLVIARAQAHLGDFVSARLLLERTRAVTTEAEQRAIIAVECGEIAYQLGEQTTALTEAENAIALTSSLSTRLAARSIVGKILLARGAWEVADKHFAEDALSARGAGDRQSELRARINRGIALLSRGLLDDARRVFGDARADGELFGVSRAVELALSNLGVVAYRQRDYVGALRYWEANLNQLEVLSRESSIHGLTNLAELRLRLGLVENAEHAILFAQKLSAGQPTPARTTVLKLMSAQVALARGSTELAQDEIQAAMAQARASGNVEFIGATAIVGARIALADGDVRGAESWITIASEGAKTARSMAELTSLRAMLYRAQGRPALATAHEALALARDAAEDDLLIDVHALIATCSRDEGDFAAARIHCTRALAIRDRVASSLPVDMRDAFLAKGEVLALGELEQTLSASEDSSKRLVDAPSSAPSPSSHARVRSDSVLVGTNPRMRSLLLAVRKAAASDATVLVCGESGTGKELVARALHETSDRAAGPLVTVNCAALVETLLLSELFGHEKGSFTGASSRRRGRFELADGGTLFLDEIGDISARTQVALLRVLQDKTFERIGGTTTLRADVRVVCATHRDLRAMVERGEFREDLYYRIRGITLEVPPLRERASDIPLLATHLLGRIAAEQRLPAPKVLDASALKVLAKHRWPGNVRELENVLRATVVFAEGEKISATDLLGAGEEWKRSAAVEAKERSERPSDVPAAAYAHVREHRVSLHDMKRQIERDCVTRALKDANGSITRAAELLGMKRPRVSQLVKQYGLSATSVESEEES